MKDKKQNETKNTTHGNPLNLNHLSVDKMSLYDIINTFKGEKRRYSSRRIVVQVPTI